MILIYLKVEFLQILNSNFIQGVNLALFSICPYSLECSKTTWKSRSEVLGWVSQKP